MSLPDHILRAPETVVLCEQAVSTCQFDESVRGVSPTQGVLNTWHLVHYQRYYTSLQRQVSEQLRKGAAPRTTNTAAQGILAPAAANEPLPVHIPRPRILVCAPSNAATDELLDRLLRDKFVDADARPYMPRVIRVGSENASLSPEAQQVRTQQALHHV